MRRCFFFSLLFLTLGASSTVQAQVVIADAMRIIHEDGIETAAVMIDDSSPGFRTIGDWTDGAFSGGYNDTYRWAGISDTNPKLAYWEPVVPMDGLYDVYVWYAAADNRYSAVKYRIGYDGGVGNAVVDQTGGQWALLGRYPMTAGKTLVQISNRISPDTVEEMLIDDGDDFFSLSGYWADGTVSQGFKEDYFFTMCQQPANATAVWEIPVMVPGNYHVEFFYSPGSNRNENVRYTVQSDEGTIERIVNQQLGNEGWNELGTFPFRTPGLYSITLSNEGPSDKVVIADALRVTYSENQGAIVPIVNVLHDRVPTPSAGDTFPVRAEVWSATPVSEVYAEYLHEDSATKQKVSLFDDGLHDDEQAADGIYGGGIPAGEAATVVEYWLGARNVAGGEVRSTTYKCLAAYEEFNEPEMRLVFTGMLKNATALDALLARVRSSHFNTVCYTARSTADSAYQSSYEPPADGIPEGFDPLGYLLERAHDTSGGQSRIDVHALVLVYRAVVGQEPAPGHILDRRPEWISETYDGRQVVTSRLYIDQGIPEAQDYLVNVFREIIENYDIDGFNLDFIRYRDNFGYNPIALSWFHHFTGRSDRPRPNDPEWCNWRRAQVTALVRRVYARMMQARPDMLLTIDGTSYGAVQEATTENAFYKVVMQDWPRWMREGSIDGVLGMAYRDELEPELAEQFREWNRFYREQRRDRQAVAIVGGYKNLIQHSLVQLHEVRRSGAPWLCFFSDGSTNHQSMSVEDFYTAARSQIFPTTVEQPPAPWKENRTTGIVFGKVMLDGQPLRLVDVVLEGGVSTQTDLAGSYVLLDVQPGAYNLVVEGSEGIPVEVNAAEVVEQDLLFHSSNAVNWEMH